MAFKDRLKEARLNCGMTQQQVAKEIGVAKSTFTGYEKGNSEPSMHSISKIMSVLNVDANFLWQDEMDTLGGNPIQLQYNEMKHIEKYRSLSEDGQQTVSYILDREVSLAKRIVELESRPDNIIEFTPSPDDVNRLVEYFNSASAGTGIFIMGNEATEQLPIPDTKENKKVDYAIKVSGNSMEPDFYDGDIALVSHREELNYGDVGIFIINNNAYIKEYGEKELISRNPKADNIMIEEYDNIVCMGKVIGKL